MSVQIKSTTKTGIEVTLTGEDHYGQPVVRVDFDHPKAGKVSFAASGYGTVQGNDGVLGSFSGQRACVTVPRADYDAALAEARAIGEREKEDIVAGRRKIKLHYRDGEYLSGYAASGREAELLRGLGLAKDVDGWGYHVDSKVAEALGDEFTYAQAAEFARPALEEKRAKADAAKLNREAKFAEARQTGRPVELSRWTEECCEKDFDCSLDIVAEYALPTGGTKLERTHTH